MPNEEALTVFAQRVEIPIFIWKLLPFEIVDMIVLKKNIFANPRPVIFEYMYANVYVGTC